MIEPTFPGLVQPIEGRRLADLAATVPSDRAIVEVGSHTGLSTAWLALGSKRGARAHVVAVDTWADPRPRPADRSYNDDPFELRTGDAVLERFLENLSFVRAWPNVTVLRTGSLDAARSWVQPIGLLFVDAIHTYEAVLADYQAWEPFIRSGGWLALHDVYEDPERTRLAGPGRLVEEVLRPSGLWIEELVTHGLWTARRL